MRIHHFYPISEYYFLFFYFGAYLNEDFCRCYRFPYLILKELFVFGYTKVCVENIVRNRNGFFNLCLSQRC